MPALHRLVVMVNNALYKFVFCFRPSDFSNSTRGSDIASPTPYVVLSRTMPVQRDDQHRERKIRRFTKIKMSPQVDVEQVDEVELQRLSGAAVKKLDTVSVRICTACV